MKQLLRVMLLLLPVMVSANLIQYPAFTPDGSVTFTNQGDIWQLGSGASRGERITAHINRETEGLVSPDGGKLAFVTDRHGDQELYLLSLTDNSLSRLTWTDTRKHICFWHDGQLYATERNTGLYPRRYRLYRFDQQGGQTLVIDDDCGAADISPDGRTIVYTRRSVGWTRKHYRGSKNNELYLYHISSGEFQRLTDSPWNEAWAHFSADGKQLYFVSDEDSTRNLYRYDLQGGQQQQLTYFQDDGILFPRMDADRSEIVFTRFNQLYIHNLTSGVTRELHPQLAGSPTFNTVTREPVGGHAGAFCVSPDQKSLVSSIRGDLFLTRREDKRTIQLTDDLWHNDYPLFTPGGDTLYFTSDRGGLKAVWRLTHPDTALTLEQDYYRALSPVTDLDQWVREFTLSPDGEKIALTCGYNRIVIHNLKTGRSSDLISGYQPSHLTWHKDSNWLLYQNGNGEFNQDVFLIETTASNPQPFNISSHPKDDSRGVLSPNGNWVAWIHEARKQREPQIATLTHRVWEMSREEIEDAFDDDSTTTELTVDRTGLFDRVSPMAHPSGQVTRLLFSPDSKQMIYVLRYENRDHLYRADWEGEDEKEIASASHISGLLWREKGNRIYFRTGGNIKYVSAGGGDTETVEFSGEQVIDQIALQEQKFRTLWQKMNDNFYDPGFHGVNWNHMYHKYHDLAVSQVLDEDFNTVAEMMLGELNSSHQGVSGGQNNVSGDAGSFLGVTTEPVRSGRGLKVVAVLPHGPADLGVEGLLPDDIILEINHSPLVGNTSIQSLLIGRAWEQVTLLVRRDHEELVLQLIPSPGWRFSQLVYRQWVTDNRLLVDNLSLGRAAYVHISGMNWNSTMHFERELFARTRDREVLIIDVRNNGGGYTTDYLLTMLNYQPHAYTIGRDGEPGYPQGRIPFYYWHRPVVVLCNEYSFSNAEIFAHAIKTLKRGSIVGSPTAGGVISTDGFSLGDGTRVRQPFRGWYTIDTGMNLENNGCQPQITAGLEPADIKAGDDPQLEAAVREALLQIQQ
jgi:tricorn protease